MIESGRFETLVCENSVLFSAAWPKGLEHYSFGPGEPTEGKEEAENGRVYINKARTSS